MPEKNAPPIHPTGVKLTVTLVWMTFGPIVWALHLTVVYGAHTLACARGVNPDLFGISFSAFAIIAATIVALAALALAIYLHPQRTGDAPPDIREERIFEKRVTNWLAALAAFGIFWAGAGALLVSPCLAIR